MRTFLCSLVVALTAAMNPSFAQCSCPTVIPPGTTHTVSFPHPSDDVLDPGAEWVGDPQGYEVDPVSANDPMGSGSIDENGNMTLDVKNEEGNLSGPNGETQNGAGEGNPIEVKICRNSRKKKTVTKGKATTVEPNGIGNSEWETETTVIWTYKKHCVGTASLSA